MVKKLFFILVFLFFALPLEAQQDINFYSDVSPRAGNTDDTFILSVVIENASRSAAPYLMGGDDFEVQLLGPRQSTSIINGVVSTELAYNYQLTPKHEGLLESPAAEVEISGKKYTAPSIKIKVSKSATPRDNGTAGNGIILKQSLDTNKIYLGEQAGYSLSLYAAVPIYDYGFSDEPLDGFWGQNAGDVEKSYSTIDDRRYNLYRWHKALFPLRTGQIQIPERTLTAQIQVKSKARNFPFGFNDPFDDPFDSFFGASQVEKREFKSNSLTVDVLPLPPKPAGFENWGMTNVLVGETSIDVSGDMSPAKTGESKTITVTIRSKGNLNAYNKLPLTDSPDYRIYQDNPIEKNTEDGGQLVMSKIIKLSIIPLKPGRFTLPSIRLGYFDPKSAVYKEAATEKIEFEASGADLRSKEEVSKPVADSPADTAKPEPPKPVKYEEDSFLKRMSSQVSLSLALFAAAVLLFLAYFIALLIRYSKKSDAKKSGLRDIQAAENPAALSDAALTAIREKLQIPAEYSYGDQLRSVLNKKLPNQQLRYRLQSALDMLESVQYSGAKNSDFKLQDLKSEFIEILPML
jgi:hypothetical protein